MPGGLCAAGAKEQTNTVRISVMKDQSKEIKTSKAIGAVLPTNITAQRNNHHTHIHTHKLHE